MPATKASKPKAKRLTPHESRQAALEAARHILTEQGPRAVTLKAVATAIGRTHANLLHHFGSAFELQQALARHICGRIIKSVEQTMDEFRESRDVDRAADQIVQLAFDAFDREGGGPLAAWMITNGQPDAFNSVLETIVDMVNELKQRDTVAEEADYQVTQLILLAFGNSILGPQTCRAFGMDKDVVRTESRKVIAEGLIVASGQHDE